MPRRSVFHDTFEEEEKKEKQKKGKKKGRKKKAEEETKAGEKTEAPLDEVKDVGKEEREKGKEQESSQCHSAISLTSAPPRVSLSCFTFVFWISF